MIQPRPRARHLFNGDCNFLFADHFNGDSGGRYDPGVIDRYLDRLADVGIDTYLANANGQRPWYPSRSLEHVLSGYRRGDRDHVRGQLPRPGPDCTAADLEAGLAMHTRMLDRMLDLQEAGIDWLERIVSRCQQRGMQPWVTLRMNDNHGANNWSESYFNCPPQRDPQQRLTGRWLDPQAPPATPLKACDYSKPAVRDYMLAMIDELLRDYAFDGVELDWMRCPLCCNPPASAEEIATITDWHRAVRERTDARAQRSGRPCVLGLRVPPRLDMLRHIGLDVADMAQSGIINFVAVSNYLQSTWDVDHAALRDRLSGIAVFGVVETLANYLPIAREDDPAQTNIRRISASAELVRGAAANKWCSGVDGLYWFNFFCAAAPCYAAIDGADDLEQLRGQAKLYTLASSPGFAAWEPFESAEQLPMLLDPGSQRSFSLFMCAEPDADRQLIIQLVLDRTDQAPTSLGVGINDHWPSFASQETDTTLVPVAGLSRHLPQHRALNYRFDAAQLRDGGNRITLYNGCTGNDALHTPAARAITLRNIDVYVTGA